MLNVGVVGVAHIHMPNFAKRMKERIDVKVQKVWDPEAKRAQKYADDLSAFAVKKLDEIWNDPNISAVVICSETKLHQDLVLAAAKAKKHMFVEKPLGFSAADAFRMASAIEKAKVLFQTGYMMRGSPVNMFVREHIKKGSFGEVTRIRLSVCHSGSLKGWFDTDYRWMADAKQAGCGGYGDLGTHGLDLMLWMMDRPVERVTADLGTLTGRYGKIDEFGEGLLHFKGGAIGSLAASWVDAAHPVSMLVSGTKGHAYVADGKFYFQSDTVDGADGKAPWTNLPTALPHAFELFLDAALGKPNQPLVTVREAAVRNAVMEALYQGAKRGAWVKPKTK